MTTWAGITIGPKRLGKCLLFTMMILASRAQRMTAFRPFKSLDGFP
jgi:hypothetical protein